MRENSEQRADTSAGKRTFPGPEGPCSRSVRQIPLASFNDYIDFFGFSDFVGSVEPICCNRQGFFLTAAGIADPASGYREG